MIFYCVESVDSFESYSKLSTVTYKLHLDEYLDESFFYCVNSLSIPQDEIHKNVTNDLSPILCEDTTYKTLRYIRGDYSKSQTSIFYQKERSSPEISDPNIGIRSLRHGSNILVTEYQTILRSICGCTGVHNISKNYQRKDVKAVISILNAAYEPLCHWIKFLCQILYL